MIYSDLLDWFILAIPVREVSDLRESYVILFPMKILESSYICLLLCLSLSFLLSREYIQLEQPKMAFGYCWVRYGIYQTLTFIYCRFTGLKFCIIFTEKNEYNVPNWGQCIFRPQLLYEKVSQAHYGPVQLSHANTNAYLQLQ